MGAQSLKRVCLARHRSAQVVRICRLGIQVVQRAGNLQRCNPRDHAIGIFLRQQYLLLQQCADAGHIGCSALAARRPGFTYLKAGGQRSGNGPAGGLQRHCAIKPCCRLAHLQAQLAGGGVVELEVAGGRAASGHCSKGGSATRLVVFCW